MSSFISLLFRCRRPATVGWFVIPHIVSTVNRFLFWPLAHVSKKILERIFPSVTNFYSSPSIVIEMCRFRIGAALNHSNPCYVSWREFSVCGMTMSSSPKTSATGSRLTQIGSSDNFQISAITKTKPVDSISCRSSRRPLCNESSKSLSSDILKLVSHDYASIAANRVELKLRGIYV